MTGATLIREIASIPAFWSELIYLFTYLFLCIRSPHHDLCCPSEALALTLLNHGKDEISKVGNCLSKTKMSSNHDYEAALDMNDFISMNLGS